MGSTSSTMSRKKASTAPNLSPAKFPYGTLSLSFIGAKDWTHKEKFFRKVSNFDSGFYFACQEKYGGNSFNLIYPYFHISRSNTLQKQIYHLKGDSNEWLEQGVITQIDQVSSSSSAFAIS